MPNRLGGSQIAGYASSDGGRTTSERVLCLFDPGEPADGQFLQVAESLADGGRFVVPVRDASVAESLKPSSSDASADYETRFLERPSTVTAEWVTDVVDRFDITVIFDIRDRKAMLGGGELALASGGTHVTVTRDSQLEGISSVLVPVARGPHLDATLDMARAFAESSDAWVDLFHVVEEEETESDVDDLFEYCSDRLLGFANFDTWRYEGEEGESPAQAIVEQSSYYDATVVGAPQKGRLREFVDGSTTEIVQSLCENAVVTVRSGEVEVSRLDRWLGEFLAPKR
ncbi:universal stress protein [Halogeometricum sp. S1BR25-6]|uniref:Universal stress protein n=1 Tax=Halogeometricum salsisoli TaxID=2950536 RepID=A0ABU2GJ40_9EURY|nr:universal stress protein [Halogeometricum sp. S1BR25-6]MDS0300858.1 universal stress protein [Halogeometricum sp. S1BR25-6]